MHYLLTIAIFLIISCNLREIKANDENYLNFPDGFTIGVSGSAYQIEGAWNVSDKSPSNWDSFVHEHSEKIKDASNADISCDTYNKYKEDIQITKNGGFNHYRLSLSWPRILPKGFGNEISQDGIQYYKNVLDELHAQGIEPFVTIYHWDHPEIIDKMGGWLNEIIVEYFADYARIVFKELGSRIKTWTTINEPGTNCQFAYGEGVFSPGLKMKGIGPYICMHNSLKAHARAYRIYDEEFRSTQNGKIGIVNSCLYFNTLDKNDDEILDTAFQYDCGWTYHPIFSKTGNYPNVMIKRINENSILEGLSRSRLPVFSKYWIDYIKGTYDYMGLNHYGSQNISFIPKNNESGWYEDSGIFVVNEKISPTSITDGFAIASKEFGHLLRKVKDEYDNPELYIMENGYFHDCIDSNLLDKDRIDFLYTYIKELFLALHRDKCNIKAYTIWSLLDNFEWNAGFTRCYGLVHVNFTVPNRTRTPRLSMKWLKNVIDNQKLVAFDESKNYD